MAFEDDSEGATEALEICTQSEATSLRAFFITSGQLRVTALP